MYLVICKNKYGLSIADTSEYATEANAMKDRLQRNKMKGESYHVRKFDLASIDLARLMEEGE